MIDTIEVPKYREPLSNTALCGLLSRILEKLLSGQEDKIKWAEVPGIIYQLNQAGITVRGDIDSKDFGRIKVRYIVLENVRLEVE